MGCEILTSSMETTINCYLFRKACNDVIEVFFEGNKVDSFTPNLDIANSFYKFALACDSYFRRD